MTASQRASWWQALRLECDRVSGYMQDAAQPLEDRVQALTGLPTPRLAGVDGDGRLRFYVGLSQRTFSPAELDG